MKPFGKVESRFWDSEDISRLSIHAKLMAIYLLTCKHGNMIGVFRLPTGYITSDLQFTEKQVENALSELLASNFLKRSPNAYFCILKFIDYNDTRNLDQFKARIKQVEQLPKDMLPDTLYLLKALKTKASSGKGYKEELKRLEALYLTASSPLASSEESDRPEKREKREESREKRIENNSIVRSRNRTSDDDELSDTFDQWWKHYPKREGSQGNRKTAFKRYKTRRKVFSVDELLMGLMRYGRFCNETGKTGTEYVKQATTFLNDPDNITNPWTVNHEARQPLTPYEQALKANEATLIQGGYLQPATTGDGEPGQHRGAVYDHDAVVPEQVDEGMGVDRQGRDLAERTEGFAPEADRSGHDPGEGIRQ